jgi:hypothetical protein
MGDILNSSNRGVTKMTHPVQASVKGQQKNFKTVSEAFTFITEFPLPQHTNGAKMVKDSWHYERYDRITVQAVNWDNGYFQHMGEIIVFKEVE